MMGSPFTQLRERLSGSAGAIDRRNLADHASTPPAFIGRVFAQSSVPTSPGRYFAVHPITVFGTEGEANSGTLSLDTSTTVLVYVIGSSAPAAGDDLICRFIGSRWIAERMQGGGSGTVTLPGCLCSATPTTLQMTSGSPSCNGGMFQNCTLVYGTTPEGYSALDLGNSCFLSTQSFLDNDTGDYFQYYFSCNSNFFTLSRVYLESILGSPYRDIVRYSWLINAPGNSCLPFLLSNGQVFQGGDPTCVVTISE